MKVIVALPSYNECQTIREVTNQILNLDWDIEVCIVDDSSPDGTSNLVRKESVENHTWKERVHLIVRTGKEGRGAAVRAAMEWANNREELYDAFVEMDCDLSHQPAAIKDGLRLLEEGYDVVLGCRYPDGVVEGWPIRRRVFSRLANLLARLLIDWSIPDYTNGFRFYKSDVIGTLLNHKPLHSGYIYLSETLSCILKEGFRIGTFPIYFKNREKGKSNTDLREIINSLMGIFAVAVRHHFK
jgi:dolichol-phosphate mannosyltransferase